MIDAELVECELSGDEYKAQGLATHQHFCDEKPNKKDTADTVDEDIPGT